MKRVKYIIYGTYKGQTEEIDEFETKSEAARCLGEYRMSFGGDWHLWIVERLD